MLRVGSDFKGEFLVALAFEEAGNFVVLVLGDGREELLCGFQISAEDESLVFNNS